MQEKKMKIAVKVTNWVGDVVMNLPALEVIREHYPNAEIVAIARGWVKHLFYFRKDLVDRVVIFDDKSMKGLGQLWAFGKSLREEKFDIGIALTRHFKGAFLLWAAGIPQRIGFSTAPSRLFLNRPLSREVLPKNRHQSMNYVDLLRKAGGMEAEDRPPRLIQDGELAKNLRETYLPEGASGPLMVLHPGAAYGSAKQWYPERFGQMAQSFLENHGGHVVTLGMPHEQDGAAIAANVSHPGYVDLIGKCNLKESIGFTSIADVVVTNDSGMMHVAGAFGISQVAIFGPTDVTATFPLNPKAEILHHKVSCSPCKHRECPIGHDCMKAITVDQVSDAVTAQLSQA